MELQINYDYREDDVRSLLDVEKLALSVLEQQDCPKNTEVSINFVTDDQIHELNKLYRQIDRPTDVLSFECDGVEDGFTEVGFDQDTPFELGDIFIAVDKAEAQAPEYAMTLSDELSLLITHGLLHLCGFDHMEEEEAQMMEAREVELLSSFWDRPFSRHGVGE